MDCMDFLKTCKDKEFDLAIVDPPYGIGLAEWDFVKPTDEYFAELKRVSKNQIIWGGNYFAHQLPITESWICWNKKPFLKQQAHFELAWTSFETKPKMYDYTYAGNAEGINNIRVDYNKKSIHPAQKPSNIYIMILQDYAKPNDKILDTYLGSGSIAIAVLKANNIEKMNLTLTGCELDKDYFDAMQKRIKSFQSQTTIFDE